MTNLILSLLVSSNVMLRWDPSPDTSVVSYLVHASLVSRYTNGMVLKDMTPPVLPGGTAEASRLSARSIAMGTNPNWQAECNVGHWGVIGTNWTIPARLENTRAFYAVTAIDANEVESDLSNEVLFNANWLWVKFAIEDSTDLNNWSVLGSTNLWRVWHPRSNVFLRGRMVIEQ